MYTLLDNSKDCTTLCRNSVTIDDDPYVASVPAELSHSYVIYASLPSLLLATKCWSMVDKDTSPVETEDEPICWTSSEKVYDRRTFELIVSIRSKWSIK